MKFNNIVSGAKLGLGKAWLATKAHSPEILAVVGVGAIIAGVVVACKSTVKAIDIHEEYKEDVRKIDEVCRDSEEYGYNPNEVVEVDGIPVTMTQENKDRTILKVQYGWRYVKTYLLAFLLVGGGICCLLGSSHILRNRWLGMSAAYTALQKANDEYRKRVGAEVGEEKEKDLWQNIKALEVTKDDENGIPVTQTVKTLSGTKLGSPYAVIFDEHCDGWTKSPYANRTFIVSVQNYANDILHSRGFVYLHEVYTWLGLKYEPKNGRYDISPEQAQASRHVGWLSDGNGDGFIDFGLNEAYREPFMDGADPSVLLDFNVDGDIEAPMYKVKR